MGKKCIPGLFCVENMTLFLCFITVLFLLWFYFHITKSTPRRVVVPQQSSPIFITTTTETDFRNLPIVAPMGGISTTNDIYAMPPVTNNAGFYYPRTFTDIRGTIPIQTRAGYTLPNTFSQIGILTNENKPDMILTLMGKPAINARDKWNYYTISNTGFVNTKLPIRIKGKNCSGEYGCDEIGNGDAVFVEGYKDNFVATVWDNVSFPYSPF